MLPWTGSCRGRDAAILGVPPSLSIQNMHTPQQLYLCALHQCNLSAQMFGRVQSLSGAQLATRSS